ncbi:hypothetical protein EJB05_21784, partial [Eragrostis curvula]
MFAEWKAKFEQTYKDVGEEECRGLAKEEIFRGHGVRKGEASYEEETRREFAGWKAGYGKTYRDAGEEECRYKLFKGNRRVVVLLNNAAAGEAAYGLNQFGDLTNEEVRASCYGRVGGVRNNLEIEGELSSRCQAIATSMQYQDHVEARLIWSPVCQCIATELKQSTESGGSAIPGDEGHMWL